MPVMMKVSCANPEHATETDCMHGSVRVQEMLIFGISTSKKICLHVQFQKEPASKSSKLATSLTEPSFWKGYVQTTIRAGRRIGRDMYSLQSNPSHNETKVL